MLYQIKRGSTVVATVWPIGQQEKEIMIKDIVPISFSSPAPYFFEIGDTIQVYGETYYLNQLDEPKKNSTLSYEYSLMFQAAYYSLAKPIMMFYDSANALKVIKFEVMINARQLLDLIVANANRTQSGWVAGDCIDSEFKMMPFNGESVLTAIDNGAKEFKTEWWIVNKVIHFMKKGAVSGHSFEYGYNKGLRGGLTRTNVDSSSVFSRLYVTGSDQNLPPNYRNSQKNLMLPEPLEYIQGPKYGADEIEAVINFPDIKPERIGTISSVTSPFIFSDADLDFDLNEWMLPGDVRPKVSFLTGNLAGYWFEVPKGGYNHSSRTIKILKNEVEKAIELPSDLMKPEIGDTYFFFDMIMPPSYVEAKEQELLEKGTEHFNAQSVPRVAYDVPPDHFFFRRNNVVLNLGDYVHMKDVELRLDKDIRINSYERDLHDPHKYPTLRISDLPVGNAYVRAVAEAEKVTKALEISQVNNIQRARNNWRATNELVTMLETLKAEMLLITVEGGAYTTDIGSTTTIDHFQTTSGNIYHEQFKENNGIWHVPVFAVDLVDNIPYYAYVKASKFSTSAEIVLSETKIPVDQDTAFYHLPFGVISSILEGGRLFTPTRGYSKVVGDLIDTGRIVSHDGTQYWDLNGSLFNIGTALSGMDWGVTEEGTLTISGRIVATNAEFINLAVQNLKTAASGARIEILAADPYSSLTFYDNMERDITVMDERAANFVDDDPSHTSRYLSGMVFNKYYWSNPTNPDVVNITGNGIYSNTGYAAAKLENDPGSDAFVYASVVGYIRRVHPGLGMDDIHAAIAGLGNTSTSVGGYFKHMLTGGTALMIEGKIKAVDDSGAARTAIHGIKQIGAQFTVGSINYYPAIEYVNGVAVRYGSYSLADNVWVDYTVFA